MKPKVGDMAKANYYDEETWAYGVIIDIDEEHDLAYAKLEGYPEFCGDIPTKHDGDCWVFEGF